MPRHHILQHHDRHASRKASSHQRESQEQHQPRLPRDTAPAIAEAISGQSRFLDAVDDQHAEGAADSGDPINEVHVHSRGVEDGFGVDGRVDERVEAYCELEISMSAIYLVRHQGGEAYEGTGNVDASRASVGAVQPLELGEAEDAV
jgi:hypothetical protein